MRKLLFVWLLAACGSKSHAPADMSGPDMTPYPRTLTTNALSPTPPENLLNDPFVGGEGNGDYGQFRAFFELSGDQITMMRTFDSRSPVGGAVSIERLPFGGVTGDTAEALAPFLGGSGTFAASIWMSFADATGAPETYAQVQQTVAVFLLDNAGNHKTELMPVAAGPVTFGSRSWIKLATEGDVELPSGGSMEIRVSDPTLDMEMAAPEVTASALGGPQAHHSAKLLPMTDADRAAIRHMIALSRPQRHRTR